MRDQVQDIVASHPGDNSLLALAQPLLRALAHTPEHLDTNGVEARRAMLVNAVRKFQQSCVASGVPRETVRNASYCLCAALDEAAMRTAWGRNDGRGNEWITQGLCLTLHGDRQGADRVYRLLEREIASPNQHGDFLALIDAILKLGFRGRYRFEPDGQRKMEQVQQALDVAIQDGDAAQSNALPRASLAIRITANNPSSAKHWRSDRMGAAAPLQVSLLVDLAIDRRRLRRIALMMFGAVLTALAVGAVWRWHSLSATNTVAQAQPQRADFGEVAQQMRTALSNELAAGTVSMEADTLGEVIRLRCNDVFQSGASTVNPWAGPILAKIGRELVQTTGAVEVTGYADGTTTLNTGAAMNQALSEQRATQTGRILQAAGVSPNRLSTKGKGDADPIASNMTAYGRSRNRRVEITIWTKSRGIESPALGRQTSQSQQAAAA
ncbi:type IVB secretion system protein IcmH/DotU [Ralstonia sp. UBA689]|uniref:type IVB secretion system protein IcmH/DotU n=1 Tax=Ralstonia sp. UBA689 TaxID=1947373 RepID=UPI0025E0D07B|nr:type IVB secretion system protein IcmH/DotU [Ralstonia sp. UBA689]